MQTFLPFADYQKSAECLDSKRLGKQRVEVKQVFNALIGRAKGWGNHPITRMWQGYEYHLLLYGAAICTEWFKRGYSDSLWY